MTKYLTAFLLLFICFSSCKKKNGDAIADAKKIAAKINGNLKKYTVRHQDDLTAVGGGTITGYYRDDEVKKIYAEHFTDNGRTFSEYYFDDGMLVLIVKQVFIYNKPVSYTEAKAKENNDSVWYDDKKTKLEVYYYYFNDNKLIKWTGGDDKDISVSAANFADVESSLWAETAILLKQLNP